MKPILTWLNLFYHNHYNVNFLNESVDNSSGNKMELNTTTLEYAIEANKVLTVTSHAYLGQERKMIDTILARYLKEVGLDDNLNNISYCIHEAACNAYKANLKRLYFDLKNINILDPQDYNRGMSSFSSEVLHQPKRFTLKHKEKGYYVKLQFYIEDPLLRVVIRNNVHLTHQEKKRIREKMLLARGASNMLDVYAQAEDDTEGAGLGIVMLHVILKNLGFKGEPVQIHSTKRETICSLCLNIRELEGTPNNDPLMTAGS